MTCRLVVSSTALPSEGALRMRSGKAGSAALAGLEKTCHQSLYRHG